MNSFPGSGHTIPETDAFPTAGTVHTFGWFYMIFRLSIVGLCRPVQSCSGSPQPDARDCAEIGNLAGQRKGVLNLGNIV